MTDNMNDKIGKVAENQLLIVINRVATPILLMLMAFLGTQVWGDIRKVSDNVVTIRIEQAQASQRINDHERRIDRLETYGSGGRP